MEITITTGNINHLDDCEDAIVNSELGKDTEKGSVNMQ